MPFAVVQKELSTVGSDALLAALKHVPHLTKHDADFLARDAFGVLVDRLSFREASGVQAILDGRGVDTEVVDQAEIPTLPPPKKLRRMDCLAEHLVLYDALGRPKPTPWEKVRLLAAGVVAVIESTRTQRTTVSYRAGHYGAFPIYRTEYGNKEELADRLLVDLFVEDFPARYQSMARELRYDYLGDRLASTAAENFVTLVADERIVITSLSAKGVLNGVYDFLESLGCRWFAPGTDGEFIPSLETITLSPKLDVKTPSSNTITYFQDDGAARDYSDRKQWRVQVRNDLDLIDWIGKNKVTHTMGTLGRGAGRIDRLYAERALRTEIGGHVIPSLLPRKLFDTHPEYFPIGKDGSRFRDGNACCSSKGALQVIAKNAAAQARKSSADVYHIWGADVGGGYWCRCEPETALSGYRRFSSNRHGVVFR